MDYNRAEAVSIRESIEQGLRQALSQPEGSPMRIEMEKRIRKNAIRYHQLTGEHFRRRWH